MSLERKMVWYAAKCEFRLRDEMHKLGEKTKFNIRREASLIARDYKEMGYKVNTKFQSPTQITKEDFIKLAGYWKEKGYEVGTMQDKAFALRQILTVAGNTDAAEMTNAELGISEGRDVLNRANENRGCAPISRESFQKLESNKVAYAATKLIEAYGLRRDESIHVVQALSLNHIVVKEGKLALQASWCKNNNPRAFEIRDQGKTLSEMRTFLNGVKMDKKIEYYRGVMDRAFGKLKQYENNEDIHPHALRHNYSQTRYFELTGGMTAPSAGGKSYNDMDQSERRKYDHAVKIIAHEMGHNRSEISRTYVGK